jgi:hypothetical protein
MKFEIKSEDVKASAEAFAIFSAGLYFLFKLLQGYFFPNLSLAIECQRRRLPDSRLDDLVILAKLKKGDRGSMLIHHAQARIQCRGRDDQIVDMIGYTRSSCNTLQIGSWKQRQINWKRTSAASPVLRITPGEELSTKAEVSQSEACVVEVAILGGERIWFGIGQWKASHISEPNA